MYRPQERPVPVRRQPSSRVVCSRAALSPSTSAAPAGPGVTAPAVLPSTLSVPQAGEAGQPLGKTGRDFRGWGRRARSAWLPPGEGIRVARFRRGPDDCLRWSRRTGVGGWAPTLRSSSVAGGGRPARRRVHGRHGARPCRVGRRPAVRGDPPLCSCPAALVARRGRECCPADPCARPGRTREAPDGRRARRSTRPPARRPALLRLPEREGPRTGGSAAHHRAARRGPVPRLPSRPHPSLSAPLARAGAAAVTEVGDWPRAVASSAPRP